MVLGTRPEIIKLGHVIRLLGPAARVIHTGQHFDDDLSKIFFGAFGLVAPPVTIGVGGATRGTQIGRSVAELDARFAAERPVAVVVQGDTNSAVAGAIAANANDIPLVHVESGLRSHDRRMPEEHNRVIADHLADLCCAPTETNRANLHAEAISDDRIVVTGNTIVEALRALLPDPAARTALLTKHDLTPAGFVLGTFHRPENVDDPAVLETILEQLASLPVPVVLPLHPRTRIRISTHAKLAALAARLTVLEPLGYAEFLGLAAESAMLISDSGGVQEEASLLKRPVVVVRRSTERPEVLGTFAELIPPGPQISKQARAWLGDVAALHDRLATIASPYGDGTASQRTVDGIGALVDA